MKQSIENYFPRIKSFATLDEIVRNSRADLSFWGTRSVIIGGPRGERVLSIDALAACAMRIINQNPQLFLREHAIGRTVFSRITQIYNDVDRLVENRCLLIRMMIAIGDLTNLRIFASGWSTTSKIRLLWRGREYLNEDDEGVDKIFKFCVLEYFPKRELCSNEAQEIMDGPVWDPEQGIGDNFMGYDVEKKEMKKPDPKLKRPIGLRIFGRNIISQKNDVAYLESRGCVFQGIGLGGDAISVRYVPVSK